MSSSPHVGIPRPVPRNRWYVVGAAILLNLVLGALYSWPVFSNHLERTVEEELRWKHVETQLVFSMATVFLAVGVIAAGQLSERYPPRRLILLSAAFTGGGYLLGGLLPLTVAFVAPTIGAMVGFGIGVAYALPISLAARWFPDRKGLVTGVAMAGFGTGSVLWSQVFHLLLHDTLGISGTFVLYGVLFAGLILLTMRFLVDPPAGYAEALASRSGRRTDARPGPQTARPIAAPGDGFLRSEIVTQRQFYFLFFTFVVGSAIGLMVIGMSKSYPVERLVAAGWPAATARRATNLAALVLFPVFNGSGRIVFGWLSDRLGWKPVLVASCVLQSVLLAFLPTLMSVPATVYVSLVLLAMCYGGNFTVFPVATGQIWGYAHLAANYSLVFVAFGVGAVVGPPLSGMARDAGIIDIAFRIASGLLAVGALLVGILRAPVRSGLACQAGRGGAYSGP